MRVDDFDYPLPDDLIAQDPLPRRDASRLMVVPPGTGVGGIRHRRFWDLPDWLRPGDCLVLNDSRVIPARLFARRPAAGGRVEILLVERLDDGSHGGRQEWRAMVRPGRRVREGETLLLADDLYCRVVARDEQGGRRLRFEGPELERRLRALGRMPLPPYIRRELRDPQRYQTVYAACEGSIAAPTAGLHFTPELLDRL
ncbi:MAG TPA: S-adenosylmethionine:tRNA ribosyltransferase-isomerase, partial [Bacillota bacterium]